MTGRTFRSYLAWAFLVAAFLLVAAGPGGALAQNKGELSSRDPLEMINPPPGDLTAQLLRRMFPLNVSEGANTPLNAGANLTAGQATAFSELITIMNKGMIMLAGVMGFWLLSVGTVASAHEGRFLGERSHSLWAPMRMLLAAAALVPMANGFSPAQMLIAKAGYAGLGLASNVWATMVKATIDGKPMVNMIDPGSQALVQSILESKVCQLFINDAMSSENYVAVDGKQQGIAVNTTQMGGKNIYGVSRFVISYDFVTGLPKFPSKPSGEMLTSMPPMPAATSSNQVLNAGICGVATINNPAFSAAVVANEKHAAALDKAPEKKIASTVFISQVQAVNAIVASSQMNELAWRVYRSFRDKGQRDPMIIRDMQNAFMTIADAYNETIKAAGTQAWNEAYSNMKTGLTSEQGTSMQAYMGAVFSTGFTGAGAHFLGLARINGQVLNSIRGQVDVSPPINSMAEGFWVRSRGLGIDNTGGKALRDELGDGGAEDLAALLTHVRSYTDVITGNPGYFAEKAAAEAGVRQGDKPISRSALDMIDFSKNGGAEFIMSQITASGGSDAVNPFQGMIDMGHTMINAAGIIWAGSKAVKMIPAGRFSKIPVVGSLIGNVVDNLEPMMGALAMALFTAGALQAYVLPMLPTVFWIIAVIGWVILFLEGIIAAPLWALAHLRLDGDNLVGPRGGIGYELVFNIVFRPILMVTGFFVAIIIYQFGGILINALFVPAMKFASAGNFAMLGGMIIWPLMAAITNISIAYICFRCTTLIADGVPRWMGIAPQYGHIDPVGEGRAAAGAMGYGALRQGAGVAQQLFAARGSDPNQGVINALKQLENKMPGNNRTTDVGVADASTDAGTMQETMVNKREKA
jgi:hypothetical protein